MMEKSCDQVLWLHHGKTRRLGDPKEVVAEYKSLSSVDRSGRMIGGETANPKQIARKRKQAAVTETLAADDRNSAWFERFSFTGVGGADLVAGQPAVIAIGLSADRSVAKPSIEVRVLAAGGTPTGFGYASGQLDGDALSSGIEATIDLLSLAAGRYNVRVDLHDDSEPVASKTMSIQVSPTATGGDEFIALPTTWNITANR